MLGLQAGSSAWSAPLTFSHELQFSSNLMQSTHLPWYLPDPDMQRAHLAGPRLQSAGQ